MAVPEVVEPPTLDAESLPERPPVVQEELASLRAELEEATDRNVARVIRQCFAGSERKDVFIDALLKVCEVDKE